ncbi:cell envelope integrity protein TolA [Acinetobacter sp. NIPH 2377]|uniref:cell envelope integrity protein TolA n=1 Tax=Acinetobacter terrestris TaxID=2529843 RepID=UPI00148FA9D3|nr:cell envelope integrity protein TolA [Acinetobacter terrestris]NNH35754.1 cell envelope integrity protein TolA [Acinetobacter terrestris]
MNAKFEIEVVDQNVVVTAFNTPGGTAELFERIAQEARSHVPDVTTKKGRDAIGSLALKVSKSKTFVEKCGKELVAEQKTQIKLIDDDRISVVKKFDDLRNEILAPRDAWEQAEKDRVAKHEESILSINFYKTAVIADKDSVWLKGVIRNVEEIVIDSSFEEFEEQAKIAKYETLEFLRTALTNREKYEAEQAELERLRQAEQVRQQQERDAKIAHEATEKANREAAQKAQLEAERVQREKLESEQREARLLAEKEAAVLREQALKIQAEQQAKQAEIDKQQAIEAERKRIEQQQAAQAEADREAEEARLANVEHMRTINREVFAAIESLSLGICEAQIKELITAIAKNQIPHVSIKY